MIFQTTLRDIELLPDGDGVSKLSGEDLLKRLASVFDYLPEGTLFRVDGEKVTITIADSATTQKVEAERLAEKAQNIAAGVPSPECMAVWKKKSNYVVPWLDAESVTRRSYFFSQTRRR